MKLGTLTVVIVSIICVLALIAFLPSNNYSEGELELKFSTDRSIFVTNESINATFCLTNVGNNSLRLVDMPNRGGLYISVYDSNGNEIYNAQEVMGICIYNQEDLVVLEPEENLTTTFMLSYLPSSYNINSTGDYYFKGVFQPYGQYSVDSGTYWNGKIDSNLVKIHVIV